MPKIFKFTFEKLRRIRKFKTKEAQRRLGESYGRLYTQQNRLAVLKKDAASERKNLSRLTSGGKIDTKKSEAVIKSLEINDAEQKVCLMEIQNIQAEIEQRRMELQEALKEEEKFNKYRDKMYAKYKKELNRKEIKEIDETASRMNANGKEIMST